MSKHTQQVHFPTREDGHWSATYWRAVVHVACASTEACVKRDVCGGPVQAMEEVKESLRALKEGGRGDLTEEQYEQKQQVLLMKWYRTTGPAKLEAGIKHIEGLIEQGAAPVLLLLVLQMLCFFRARSCRQPPTRIEGLTPACRARSVCMLNRAWLEVQHVLTGRKLVLFADPSNVLDGLTSSCVCTGRKLVVLAHHSNVLDGLEEAVRGMKYTSESGQALRAGHMRIDGSTSAKLRSEHVKTFQGSDCCRVALLSIKAAGVRPSTA